MSGFLPSTHLVYYILSQKSRVFSSSFCTKFMSILWEFLCILHMMRFYNLLIVVNKKFTNFARHAGRRATQKEKPGNQFSELTDSPMSNRTTYHRKECGGWGDTNQPPWSILPCPFDIHSITHLGAFVKGFLKIFLFFFNRRRERVAPPSVLMCERGGDLHPRPLD